MAENPPHRKMLEQERLLKSVTSGGTLIIYLDGDIDHHNARTVRQKIDAKLFIQRPRELVLDLSKVSFMDSSAIGVIIGRYKLVKSFGSEVFLVSCSDSVGKILSMSGIKKIIKIFDTLPDALSNIQRKD